MLDQPFLDYWVPTIFDKSFGPDKILENNRPLLSITLFSPEKMEEFKNRFYPDSDEKDELRGHILSMFDFMRFAKTKDYKKFKGRYLIKINSGLTLEAGIFTLMHEEAHLYGFVNNIKSHKENPDMWADDRALSRVKECIKDPSLRLKVILEGLTNDFKHM